MAIHRIAICGPAGCGKTALFRYVDELISLNFETPAPCHVAGNTSSKELMERDAFSPKYIPTHAPKITECINRGIQVWDTSGKSSFSFVPSVFAEFRACNALWLCYDTTDSGAFLALDSWVKEFKLPTSSSLAIFLVGLKVDLSEQRVTSRRKARQWCDKHGINSNSFWEVSSRVPLAGSSLLDLVSASIRTP